MNLKLASAIKRGVFLMNKVDAKSYLEALSEGNLELAATPLKTFTALKGETLSSLAQAEFSFLDPAIEKGTVGIIPIDGPMMRDDFCGDAGTLTKARLITEAANNENITSIIIPANSPGGQATGTKALHDAVVYAASKKEVTAVVDNGMAASACLWAIAGATEIVFSNETDAIGSLGVMVYLRDDSKKLEAEGIVEHTYYATNSTEKNAVIEEALNGNPEKLIAELDFLNDIFLRDVTAGRGDKLNVDAVKTGAMFYANEAIENGLGDRIVSFADILHEHLTHATENAQSNLNFKMENLETLCTTLGVDALEMTEEKGTYLNEDQLATVETSLKTGANASASVVNDMQTKLDDQMNTVSDFTAATHNAMVAAGLAEATEGEDAPIVTIEAALANIAELGAKVAEYGAQPGAVPSAAVTEGDEREETIRDAEAALLVGAAKAAKSIK